MNLFFLPATRYTRLRTKCLSILPLYSASKHRREFITSRNLFKFSISFYLNVYSFLARFLCLSVFFSSFFLLPVVVLSFVIKFFFYRDIHEAYCNEQTYLLQNIVVCSAFVPSDYSVSSSFGTRR